MKRFIETCQMVLIGLIAVASAARGQIIKEGPVPDPVAVKPLLDVAMQSPAICRGPDPAGGGAGGTFYLTGLTEGGLSLWKSADLKTWEARGPIWSGKVTSPKIQFVKGTFYIPYSRGGFGCGLLKSKSGKAEGPYEDLGSIAPEGASLSLFEDPPSPEGSGAASAGGAVYAVMDEGWIARMKDDLTGVAEQPRLMIPRAGSDFGNSPFSVGRKGAFMFKRKGLYYLVCAEWTSRTGRPVYDNYVASAKSPYGPYDCRHLMVAHGGETTVFEDGRGNWFATMSGDDVRARFRDRAAMAPLEWVKRELYFTRGIKEEFPTKPNHVITERGVWDQCRPLTDHAVRDIRVIVHTDGYVYYTGSVIDERVEDQVILFRFKADDAARVGRGEMAPEMKTIFHFKDLHWLDNENRLKYGKGKRGYGLTRYAMDSKVFFIGGTFYVTVTLYNNAGTLKTHRTFDDGKTTTSGNGVIRSRSGTWDGPWESVARAPFSQCALYEDEQGRVVTRGWRGIMALKDDGEWEVVSKAEELPDKWYPAGGMSFGDDGGTLGGVVYNDDFQAFQWGAGEWGGPASLHIEGRPGGTYDRIFSFSESGRIEGPYPRPTGILTHCANCRGFRDSKGRYWHTFFGNDSTSPWWCRMGIIPLKVEKRGHQYYVDFADEWPED